MTDEPKPLSINAVASMPSARLKLADLNFIAETAGKVHRTALTWSAREMYRVTATNFSAQSPAIKVIQTFRANSVEDFASQAPPGRIYIMEARFETPEGVVTLTLGKNGDLSRDLVLSFDGAAGPVPPWFNEVVSKLIAARLHHAGMRELYLLFAVWTLAFLPPILVAWAIVSSHMGFPGWPLVMVFGGVAWLAYAVWTPTIARFIRASSMRVTPLFAGLLRPQPVMRVPVSDLISSRLSEFRAGLRIALRRGWVAFRRSDHRHTTVIISMLALLVAVASLINDLRDK